MIDLVTYPDGHVTVTTVHGAMLASLSAASGTIIWAYPHGTRMGGIKLDTSSGYCYQLPELRACDIVSRRRSIRWTSRQLRRIERQQRKESP
jgi:hypothetical protein